MISNRKISRIINESLNRLITESFESSRIRNFFKQHGGVDRSYRNFSAGDITDDQITLWQEYPSSKDALNAKFNLLKPSYGRRTDVDMESHLEVLCANDGTAVIVGVGRNLADIGNSEGNEYQAKVADRLNRNGWNFKTRDNRYVDDSDTYYYGGDGRRSPANDFGLWTNRNYSDKLDMLDKHRAYKDFDYEGWRKDAHDDLKDYMKRHYRGVGKAPYEPR